MLKFARTHFEVPTGKRTICRITLPFGAGLWHEEAVDCLASEIWDKSEGYCDCESWCEELARTALRGFHFPYEVESEVTLYLYSTEIFS